MTSKCKVKGSVANTNTQNVTAKRRTLEKMQIKEFVKKKCKHFDLETKLIKPYNFTQLREKNFTHQLHNIMTFSASKIVSKK